MTRPSWRAPLLCLPALVLLGAVCCFQVDVPWADVWDTPGRLIEALLQGRLRASDFTWQHNESRKVIPRLFYLATASPAGLHTGPGILLQWSLLAGTFALLLRFATPRDAARDLVCGALALLVFTPAASENLTWDIQFIVIVPIFCLVLAARINASERPESVQCLCSAGLALLATYTFANGMICWLLGAPFWWRLAPGRPRRGGLWSRWDSLYALLGGAALAAYFSDYTRPPQHPAFGTDPARLLTFFLAWVGGPWVQGQTDPLPGAVILGTMLTVGAVALVIAALRSWSNLPRMTLVWMLVLAYGCSAGALTALGRSGFGLIHAVPPRYVPFAVWIPVGALGLLLALARGRPLALGAAAGAVALLGASSWPAGFSGLAQRQRLYEQGRLSLRAIDLLPQDPLLTRVHPERENLQRRVRLFAERGWLRIEQIGPWPREAAQAPASNTGGWYHVRVDGRKVHFDGWAMLPGPTREPDFLLAGVRGSDGRIELVTAIDPTLRRPEIGQVMKAPGLVRCAFEVDFEMPASAPAAGEWVLFAVDERGRVLHRLERQLQ